MPWSDVLEEMKQLRQGYPQNLVTNEDPPEETPSPAPQAIEAPQAQWYQFGDWFTSQDELLRAILSQLQAMAALQQPAPAIEQPSIQPIPPDLLAAAQQQVQLLGSVRDYLEGFNFVTGQGAVTAPGNPLELVSTVKTYLVMIRANVANTGNIYIGGKGVGAATGYILGAGEAMVVQIDNLRKSVWIDADVAGEGVSWLALID